MKKKNRYLALTCCSIIFLLTFLVGILAFEQTNDNKLKERTISYLSEKHSSEETESKLKEAFHKLPASTNTEIIDLYLRATYALANQTFIDDEMSNILYGVMDENRSFNYDKIKDPKIRETCETLKKQHINPTFINGNLLFDIDYSYFINQYGTYLNPDYLDMIKLYSEEKTIDYYDVENGSMNIDVVEDRLLKVYDIIQKYPNSNLQNSMNEYYLFYKKVYLGAYAQDYAFDSNVKLHDSLFQRYQSFILKENDNDLRNFLKQLISKYESAELTRTAEIYNIIREFCEIKNQEN